MKTKEELNNLNEEAETLNRKLAELSKEELAQVYGGTGTLRSGIAKVVNCDAVNLRDAPGGGRVICSVRADTSVSFFGIVNKFWGHVSYKGQEGYIYKDYLQY